MKLNTKTIKTTLSSVFGSRAFKRTRKIKNSLGYLRTFTDEYECEYLVQTSETDLSFLSIALSKGNANQSVVKNKDTLEKTWYFTIYEIEGYEDSDSVIKDYNISVVSKKYWNKEGSMASDSLPNKVRKLLNKNNFYEIMEGVLETERKPKEDIENDLVRIGFSKNKAFSKFIKSCL